MQILYTRVKNNGIFSSLVSCSHHHPGNILCIYFLRLLMTEQQHYYRFVRKWLPFSFLYLHVVIVVAALTFARTARLSFFACNSNCTGFLCFFIFCKSFVCSFILTSYPIKAKKLARSSQNYRTSIIHAMRVDYAAGEDNNSAELMTMMISALFFNLIYTKWWCILKNGRCYFITTRR